jgi:hypothetical protein
MIIYNITTQVNWPIHESWRKWLIEEHLPAIMGTALFTRYQLVKLMEVEEEEGATYAIQLYTDDLRKFEKFRDDHLLRVQQREKESWGDDIFSFGSLMEVIN